MQKLAVEHLPIRALKPQERNPRTHSRRQIRKLAKSIEQFGFVNPVLVADDFTILAGHGRVEAAKLLGLKSVPTLRLSHLSETERRAYVLADNKLALDAGWDRELLVLELQGLIDLGFEVELTGFETGEIDVLLSEATDAATDPGPEDCVPEVSSGPAVSRRGISGFWADTDCCAAMHATWHRFKLGQSGNPRGRSNGAKKLATLLRDALDEPVSIRAGEKVRTMPKKRAMIEVAINQARKGNVRAMLAVLKLAASSASFRLKRIANLRKRGRRCLGETSDARLPEESHGLCNRSRSRPAAAQFRS